MNDEIITAAIENDAWLTVDEAAAELKCNPVTVRRMVERGELRHRRAGRRLLISRRSVFAEDPTPEDTGAAGRYASIPQPGTEA